MIFANPGSWTNVSEIDNTDPCRYYFDIIILILICFRFLSNSSKKNNLQYNLDTRCIAFSGDFNTRYVCFFAVDFFSGFANEAFVNYGNDDNLYDAGGKIEIMTKFPCMYTLPQPLSSMQR